MSDEETVEQIKENPYPQDFPGLKQYEDKAVFHLTLFVHFRKISSSVASIIRSPRTPCQRKRPGKPQTKAMLLRAPLGPFTGVSPFVATKHESR
jgi:hypothetical protein